MFRYFTLTVLSILFYFQSIAQLLQPCATDNYNDQMMQNDPSFAINLLNAENQISAKGGQLSTQSTVVTIPVVVHIVYNTTAQNISDAQVQSQIDALNEDFRMLNSDTGNVPAAFKHLVTDAQIEFCLAQRDPLGNPTTGITRTFTNETSFTVDNKIKYTSQGGHDIWDRNQYMNIWVGPLGGSLGGYAQFPGGSAASDGIVVNTIVFGRAPYVSGAYSKGRVTVHEVGHWLNLRHLWGSGSCGDDLVNDTPIHAGANYGCPTFPKLSSCSGGDPNGELFMNHMDYTADACKVMFSADQVARMNANLSPGGLRYSLLSSLGCQAPTGNPVCDTPTNINASNITNTSAQLSWIGAGANSYNLRIRETGTSTWTSGTSSGAVINATGLTAATQYDFEVQSECTGLNSSWSGIYNFTTSGGICNTPTGLTATNVTTTSAELNWNSTGATSYNIQYRVDGTSTWTPTTSSATSVTINSLASGTQYDFQVQSDCNGTLSSWSSLANFTTTAVTPTCNTPTGLTATNVTTTSAELNWNSTGATSYNIQYRVDGTSTWTPTTSSTTSVTINSLASGTQYDFQVQSDCNGTLSSWSSVANFTTTAVTPTCNTPTGLTATNVTTTSAELNWNSTGATSYNIQYRVDGTSTWTPTTSSTTSVTINSLTSGTQFDFQVQSDCNGTLSSWSSVSNFTTTTTTPTCNTPTGLTTTNITTNSAQLNWNSTGASSYNIQYRVNGTTTWTPATSFSGTSISINSLTSGTQYNYQVQSNCNGTLSSWSSVSNFTTTTATPSCNTPIGLTTTNITTNSAQLNWNSTGASSYNIQYRVNGTTTWTPATSFSGTSISINSLTSGTQYNYQVQSNCNGTLSSWSSVSNFTTTTATPTCNTPIGLTTTNITTNSAQLNWNSTGASSYNIQYRVNGTTTWTPATSFSGTSISINSLTSGTQYNYQIQSNCNGTLSSWSSVSNFTTTTATPTCNTPTGLTATNITTTSAQLNWNSTGASSYNIQYRVNGTTPWTPATSFSGASISINSLTSGTQYNYQVQSNCNGTLSSWSSVSSFTTTTATTTCNTPTGLNANNITYNSAQLNWNSTGALSYKIQYKINGALSWTLVTSNTNSITINSLSAVTQYIFQLQSACSGGVLSPWSSGSNFTTLAPCGEPTVIYTDSISINSATVVWNSTGATSYELKFRKINDLNWSNNITSTTSFHFTGLDTNTTYEYQISSICNGSNSVYSSIQNFTTLELCNQPVSVSLISSSQSTLTLQWNPTGASSYELRFRPEGSSVWYFAIATSELIILTGLVPQTPYEIQVRSLCNSNNSNYSTLQSHQTSPFCADPSALNIALQSHGSVIISWISSNSLHYEFRYRVSGTANWNSSTVSTNQVELSNLNPATNYDFEVRSICNSIDTSGYSQTVTFNSTIVSSDNNENISTSVYPNPVNNVLFIETGFPDAIDVAVFNLMGAKINHLRINPTSGKARIDVSGFAPGVYLLKISSGRLNAISRIVKTNS